MVFDAVNGVVGFQACPNALGGRYCVWLAVETNPGGNIICVGFAARALKERDARQVLIQRHVDLGACDGREQKRHVKLAARRRVDGVGNFETSIIYMYTLGRHSISQQSNTIFVRRTSIYQLLSHTCINSPKRAAHTSSIVANRGCG